MELAGSAANQVQLAAVAAVVVQAEPVAVDPRPAGLQELAAAEEGSAVADPKQVAEIAAQLEREQAFHLARSLEG